MGDLWLLEISQIKSYLPDKFRDKAQWIKDMSRGICYEEVKERSQPVNLSACKTFNTIDKFEDLKHHIALCVLDLSTKITENLDQFKVYPTAF